MEKCGNNPLAAIKSFMETFATRHKTATAKKAPRRFHFLEGKSSSCAKCGIFY